MTTDDRTMESALAGLGVAAPASLAPNVLADVGLADRYARFDSPIGPLVVAWNGLGVSAVEAADDDATFEANHLARTGRPAHPVERVPDRLAAAIARRLEGDRRVRIDLDLRGHTDFERDVWQKALGDPTRRGPALRLDRRRDRSPEGGPGGRHGTWAQPRAAHRPVPSGGPLGRHDRPVLARRAGEQADDPGGRGPRPARDGAAGGLGRPVHRLGHDQDLLPAAPAGTLAG